MKTRREPVNICVGGLLAEARKKKGMSQADLGEAVGVTGSAVCYYETGRSRMHMTIFLRMCTALNVDPVYIISQIVTTMPAAIITGKN